MRKIFTLSLVSFVSFISKAQLRLTEDFNYQTGQITSLLGGQNVSSGLWKTVTPDGITDVAKVGTGNLTYANYFTSPSQNSNLFRMDSATGGQSRSIEDVYRDFESVTKTSNGSVYASFLIKFRNISNLSANGTSNSGDYFMAFSTSTSTTAFRSRVFVRKGVGANTIQFGISPTSFDATASPIVWSNTDWDGSATHFVTFSYQFVAGNNNDIVKVFVDKPFSATEPAADASFVFNGTEPDDLSRIVIRQATANSPQADLDAISVGTTYSSVSLPLNLTSFTGSLLNKAAVLNWTATNEVNVKGFAVEKGLNGKDFSEIAFVNAKNSDGIHEYSLEDINVKSGANYYRLKMVDKDGSARFSQVVLVNSVAGNSVTAFPNPAISNVNLSHEKANRGAVIRLVSLAGKVLNTYPVQAGATQTGVNVGQLVKGNYILVFENSGSKTVTQFTKQ